jgi:hypothetical protein
MKQSKDTPKVGLPGCSPPPKPAKPKLKKHRFCRYYDIKILRDFPFSRNQQLKLADVSTLEF